MADMFRDVAAVVAEDGILFNPASVMPPMMASRRAALGALTAPTAKS